MADALKNQFGPDVPRAIADMVKAVHPAFDRETFLGTVLAGYEVLALMPRARQIALALHQHLPPDFPKAVAILLDSLAQPHGRDMSQSLASFLFLPHTLYVAAQGQDPAHFDIAMHAQYVLTQRFSAEFSIRAFLVSQPEATLQRLREWSADPNPDVRRLVSEGSRPRLPWATRLRVFQQDPTPVLALLELLKDDPALYVRRSVANNLNDIGKDHPQLLAQTARRWLQGASAERRWIVGHALRSAVKRGEAGALQTLGFGQAAAVDVRQIEISPKPAVIGGKLMIAFALHNPAARAQRVLVDLGVHYVKAHGQPRVKVFKLKTVDLGAGETVRLHKRLSLAEMSTRKHYPGRHQVDLIVNGQARVLGAFELLA